MNDHKIRIKHRIKTAITDFKNQLIDYNTLISSIVGNLKALDNLNKELENASITLCGELEIIHFTVDSEKEHDAMLEEIKKFEPYLDKI